MTAELTARTELGSADDQLALRARDGDTRAFDTLVRRYESRLLRFALRMLNDATDAEDVLQWTFVRAYRGLRAYRPGGYFSSWIYRIALNECRRRMKTRGRQQQCTTDLDADLPAASKQEPQSVVIAGDRNRMIREAVYALPAHYREVIVLFYFDDLSVEELAQAMGISVSAAKVRLHRGRARLGAALEGRL